MASCIDSCVNVSCSPVDHDMLVHLHLHSVPQEETTCQKTGPRLSRNANCQARIEIKGARTLAIVVALCLLSIIPILFVTSLPVFWGTLLGGQVHQKLLQHIVYNVAMFLNAACNPLIYGWRNEEFRNAFRKMLKCC